MDPFSYHPPGLSPGSYAPQQPQPSPTETTGRFQPDMYARPGSSGGGTPVSAGFTATLPPLHEQPSNESVPGVNGAHAALQYGNGQSGVPRAGSSAGRKRSADVYGRTASRQGGDFRDSYSTTQSHHLDPNRSADLNDSLDFGFRDPFVRTPSAGASTDPASSYNVFGFNPPPLENPTHSAGAHHYGYFNPQTVHPSVNTRNTRPMTAPSGSGYMSGHSYSSAPSAFYVPHHQQAPLIGGTDSPLGYDVGAVEAQQVFAFQPDLSTPQAEYEAAQRNRNFSVPDALSTATLDDRPFTADAELLSASAASNPFMYQPPPSLVHVDRAGRPYANGAQGFVPVSVVDPFAAGLMQVPTPMQPVPPGSADGFAPAVEGSASRRRSSSGSNKYGFVPQQPQHTKRPRRRYDEIERMYNCDYPGCTKSYGTLNHLNSHKTMQKHGPKATPAQFKEMRKAWRERKKAEAAETARSQAKEPFAPAANMAFPLSALPAAAIAPYPVASVDRPRPSTSAGEYSYGMPTHLLTPVSFPPPPVLASANGAHLTGVPPGFTAVGAAPSIYLDVSPYASYEGFDNASALRPVTAPAYHQAPPFGGVAAAQLGQAPHYQPGLSQSLSSASVRPELSSRTPSGGEISFDQRRFSLPGSMLPAAANNKSSQMLPPASVSRSSLSSSQPRQAIPMRPVATPEMKMPQPVHAPSSYANLIGGATPGDSPDPGRHYAGRENGNSPRVNEVTAR
ncbi:hypothetical protein BMF94_4817 [Rhodotorula taiwanensis]|uniref:C2H2-type domain-containing protein n=1 Tax=Rhodotorula taiwanensis TaxID=741276 RepID=A0A2S5B5W9_9BASI|nr:hypothetical protein BMF94_4817 [Rhodotorula taiwanensis]